MTPSPHALLVAVGLGSNLPPVQRSPFDLEPPEDPRARALEGALVLLRARGHRLRAASPLYESDPERVDGVPPPGHGPFLNACILIATTSGLLALLDDCEAIEREAGRTRKGDGSPRPLDLDLLAAWREASDGPEAIPPFQDDRLTVPHPRLVARRFVLAPLAGVLADAPLMMAGGERVTPWELLRRAARSGGAGLRPGPPSASFPYREGGARAD